MDTRIIKIAVAAAALAYTVYSFINGRWGIGIAMILVTAALVLITFRSMRLIWAFLQLRQQKFDKCSGILAKINPDKLWKSQNAYYHYLQGTVLLQTNNITGSEKMFKKALNIGLRASHDRAGSKLNLAMIAMAKQKKKEAQMLIAEAKKIDTKGVLAADIKQVEKMMKAPPKVIRQQRR
jgi:predicted Zn-dependent protease